MLAWQYIHTRLAPYLSETLTRSLDRPVELGDVERVTLGSIRVGPSTIGETEDDPTAVSAESVEVRFNLLSALLTRRLSLDLVVQGAAGFLAQDEEKGWLAIETPERTPPERELFKGELDEVTVRDSVVWQSVNGERLETEELVWDDQKHIVFSDRFVKITKPGEVLYGYGFEANEDFTRWQIKALEGRIKVDGLDELRD